MCPRTTCEARPLRGVVVGVSTGGLEALRRLLGALPGSFPLPILVVQHLAAEADGGLAILLDDAVALRVKEAEEGEVPRAGTVYLAPANYHLLVESSGHLALSVDPPVNLSRPSVDVLFESAAEAWGSQVVGVILTGAGVDGSLGLAAIQAAGGGCLVQDPGEAVATGMPRSALERVQPDAVLPLAELATFLARLGRDSGPSHPSPKKHP